MKSIVSYQESFFIKGILIFLIVLSHNVIITQNANFSFFMTVVVPFHVTGFFFLPLLYGTKDVDFYPYLKKLAASILPIFFFFTLLYFGLNMLILKADVSFLDFINALFLGGSYTKKATGFLCLWFFPAFFFFSIYKYLVLNKRQYWVVALSILLTIYSIYNKGCYSYLAMDSYMSGLYFIGSAFFVNLFLRNFYSKTTVISSLVLTIVAIVASYFSQYKDIYSFSLSILLFILLFVVSKNTSIINSMLGKFMKLIGKYSLYIYVSHSLIFWGLYMGFEKYFQTSPKLLWQGMLFFAVTLLMSIIFSVGVIKSKEAIASSANK